MAEEVDTDVEAEYERLSEQVQARFERAGIEESEVERAVEWGRE